MIKVLIDARWIRSNRRGIGNFTSELIEAISKDKSEHINYVLASNSATINYFKNLYGNKFEYITTPRLPDPILDFFYFGVLNLFSRFNVIHFTGNSGLILFKKKTKIILTLHDVSFMKNFSLVPKPQRIRQMIGRMYRKSFVPLFIKYADEIITVSQFAKNDILSEFPNLTNIDYVYHGYRDNEITNNINSSLNFNLFEDKFLVISGNDPQKNIIAVIRAFTFLKNFSKKNTPSVIIIGLTKEQFLTHNPNINIDNNISFYGYIDNKLLKFAILKAKAIIIASFYESFGLPVIESLFLRKKIICSNTGALSEIAKYAALYFNPYDMDSLIDAINQIDDFDIKNVNRWIQENQNKFSWKYVAECYSSKYQIQNN